MDEHLIAHEMFSVKPMVFISLFYYPEDLDFRVAGKNHQGRSFALHFDNEKQARERYAEIQQRMRIVQNKDWYDKFKGEK